MFRATNLDELQVIKADGGEICFLLLMEEIRRPPLEVGSLSLYYLQGFIHSGWCRISSINSITQNKPSDWKIQETSLAPLGIKFNAWIGLTALSAE